MVSAWIWLAWITRTRISLKGGRDFEVTVVPCQISVVDCSRGGGGLLAVVGVITVMSFTRKATVPTLRESPRRRQSANCRRKG